MVHTGEGKSKTPSRFVLDGRGGEGTWEMLSKRREGWSEHAGRLVENLVSAKETDCQSIKLSCTSNFECLDTYLEEEIEN